MAFEAFLLVVMIVSISAWKLDANVNKVADAIITEMNLRSRYHPREIEKTDVAYFENWKISGWKLVCDRTREIRDIESFKRTADAELIPQNDTSITLQIHLGLGTFEFHYGGCSAEILGQSFDNAEVNVSPDRNSFVAQISFTKKDDECVGSLDNVDLRELGNINLKTTDDIAPMRDVILGDISFRLHYFAISMIIGHVYQYVSGIVNEPKFCKKLL